MTIIVIILQVHWQCRSRDKIIGGGRGGGEHKTSAEGTSFLKGVWGYGPPGEFGNIGSLK